MRRILIVAIAGLSLVACNSDEAKGTEKATQTTTNTETERFEQKANNAEEITDDDVDRTLFEGVFQAWIDDINQQGATADDWLGKFGKDNRADSLAEIGAAFEAEGVTFHTDIAEKMIDKELAFWQKVKDSDK